MQSRAISSSESSKCDSLSIPSLSFNVVTQLCYTDDAVDDQQPSVNMEVDGQEDPEAIRQYGISEESSHSNDAQVQPMEVECPSKLNSSKFTTGGLHRTVMVKLAR